jgi:general secretion pathway protein G
VVFWPKSKAFTIIELLVVMALIALTLTIVAPRYIRQTDRAREAVLRNNLRETRAAIDRYYSDHHQYPASLQELVDQRYLRFLPYDPIIGRSDGWSLVAPGVSASAAGISTGGLTSATGALGNTDSSAKTAPSGVGAGAFPKGTVFDLHSSSPAKSIEGSNYASW